MLLQIWRTCECEGAEEREEREEKEKREVRKRDRKRGKGTRLTENCAILARYPFIIAQHIKATGERLVLALGQRSVLFKSHAFQIAMVRIVVNWEGYAQLSDRPSNPVEWKR